MALSRSRLVVALGCVAAVVTAGTASGAQVRGETARAVLDRVQEFVAGSDSVEYTADATVATEGVEYRATAEDSAVFPNRGHSVIDSEGYYTEMLYIGNQLYARDGNAREELAGLRFAKFDAEDPDLLTGADFFFLQRPQDLDNALAGATDPRIVGEEQGQVVLQVSFPAAKLEPFVTFEVLTDVVGRLVVTPEGRPERLVVQASASSTRMEINYSFTRWNSPLAITAPKKSERDPTPLIDEEQVAAFTDTPLYQPAEIPRGWVLDLAEVLPETETGTGCKEVEVDFDEPRGDGFMLMYQLPLDCADDTPTRSEQGDRVVPREEFTAGPYRGYVEEDPDYPHEYSVALDVSTTRLEAETVGLSKRGIAQILANLVPLDLTNPPPSTIRFEAPRGR